MLVSPTCPHISSRTHVDNAAEGSDGIRSEDCICSSTCVLHYCACDHNDILRGVCELLDNKMYHLA
jgi:hypothetical protein